MADTTTHQGFDRLKELLLDKEQASLASLRTRVDGLSERVETVFDRTGTDERLTSSVAEVLDRALREAEVKRHDQLAGAVAPLVVKTIKAELRNSQEEMVEALYPITGRMVKAYVSSALRDLTDEINRRLEQNALMLRLKSLATGRSVPDLALADTQQLKVDEIYLIRRGVGELIARYPERVAGGTPSNSDMQFSGLMTAINDFASEAFADDGGAIRSFKFDDFQVYLRASPLFLLAARCRGVAPPGIETILDEEFIRALSEPVFDHEPVNPAKTPLPQLAAALERRASEAQDELVRRGVAFNPLKWLLILLALAVASWFGWSFYVDWLTSDARRRAEAALASTPGLKGYPARVTVAPRGRAVSLRGLAPDEATRAEALSRLRAAVPNAIITEQLAILPKPSNTAEVEVVRVRQQIAALETDLTRAAVGRLVNRAEARLARTLAVIQGLGSSLEEPGRKDRIARIREELAAVSGEITGYRRAAEAKDGAEDITTRTDALARASARLDAVTSALSGLLGQSEAAGDGSPAEPSALPPATGAIAVAEELSAAAERVQTISISIAVAQASRIKPMVVQQPPPSIEITPAQRLADWLRENAIFFGNGTELRDPVAVNTDLNRLAELMASTTTRLRIVGYTDERGDARRNAQLAQDRAETIRRLLIDRGVNPERLIPLGRTTRIDLSQRSGRDSPNRRVEFEIAFRYEASPPPP